MLWSMMLDEASLPVGPDDEEWVHPEATLEAPRRHLAGLLERLTRGVEGSVQTAVAGLCLHRIMQPGLPKPAMQSPALGVIAQGSKRVFCGGDEYEYDPLHYMVTSVEVPIVAQVTVASPTQPYLGLRLDLDLDAIVELIQDEKLPPAAHAEASRGMFVNRLSGEMLDAVLRLLRLVETPEDIAVLAPLVKREIFYRLLRNGQGARLRQMALQDSQTQRVAKAIRLLRENFSRSLRVESIAKDVHMSVSSLHHQFKAVTAMSPLQYQKQLRPPGSAPAHAVR